MELHPDGLLRGKPSCPLILSSLLPGHRSLHPVFGSWLFVAFLSSLIPLCPSTPPRKKVPLSSMRPISSPIPKNREEQVISSISVAQHLTQFPDLPQLLGGYQIVQKGTALNGKERNWNPKVSSTLSLPKLRSTLKRRPNLKGLMRHRFSTGEFYLQPESWSFSFLF